MKTMFELQQLQMELMEEIRAELPGEKVFWKGKKEQGSLKWWYVLGGAAKKLSLINVQVSIFNFNSVD